MNGLDWQAIGAAVVGALCQEAFHWFGLRHRLHEAKFRKMIRSPDVIAVTLLVLILSPVGAWIWCKDDGVHYPDRTYMVLGAAFPLLLKKAVEGYGRKRVAGTSGRLLTSYLNIDLIDKESIRAAEEPEIAK
jgi:hypothetical protein